MKKAILFLLALSILLSACTPSRKVDETSEIEVDLIDEEQPAELTVYVTGVPVSGQIKGEKVGYHITSYSIGPFGPLTNAPREYGHMFYEPFENFEEETGIRLNVSFFYSMEVMEDQISEDRKTGKGPDIIIGDFIGWSTSREHDNIYRLIHNGWFVDMMPYLGLDEVYDGGEYYNEVLQAGMLDGKQYALPLCFNMNALFSSKEDMSDIGVSVEEGMDSAQLLEQLEQAFVMAEDGELVLDSLSLWSVPTAFIQDYWESTGFPVANYETGEATINREVFEDVATCFAEYLKMNVTEDWDTILADAPQYLNDKAWSAYLSPGDIDTLDENINGFYMMEEAGLERINQSMFFYENSIRTSESHSLPGQCVALSSLYDDLDENMVMVSVPMYGKNDQYMAQVQRYGGVMADSKYPYHCYLLLKYLMDQEYDPYYVIPVKKANAEAMLDKLEASVYTLHLWLGAVWDYEQDFSKEVETYDIQPLPENLKQQLQHMLDNIGGAVLPEPSVYIPLVWHMEAYAFGLETMEEAYENACADMEKHLEYIMAGDSQMEFGFDGYTLSSLDPESVESEDTSAAVDTDKDTEEADDINTIRWGIFGQYDVADHDEYEFVDRLRNGLVNAALKEKGYDFEIELVFVEQKSGDQLEMALAYEEPFDIVTFESAGVGTEDMQEHLLPLEEYMAEGEVLHEVCQVYSDQIWQANQINGHNYNLGQLIGAVSPVYKFSDSEYESEPEWPADTILSGNEEEIAAYLEENDGFFYLPEPNMYGKADEVFGDYQFHMIAPGVGIDVENGTQFENIWESEYATQRLEQESQWIQKGIADSTNGSQDHNMVVYRYVDPLNEMYSTSNNVFYTQYFPITSQTHMVPLADQCYTSILKDSEKIEECLTLLAELNTDAEFCQKIYEDPGSGGMENPTGEFVYICNYYIATEEPEGAQRQNERVAALTEKQISPILGFTFDRTPVEAEIQALEAITENVSILDSQYDWIWELLEIRDDTEKYNELLEKHWSQCLEDYMQALEDAGIEKVIEEANRQLDEWRAENG